MYFGCTALAIPDTFRDPSGSSLTTIVKRHVAAVDFSSMDFSPLLYNQRSPTRPDPSLSNDSNLHHHVEAKLSDGDFTVAVRLASCNDSLVPFDDETLSGLQSKHPSFPCDIEFPEPPDDSS